MMGAVKERLMTTTRKTVCNRDCPDACGIVATVDDGGRVTRLQGDPDHPVTQGFLCFRTSHFLETQYSHARLTAPLWRASLEDAFAPIAWDDALDLAASKLLRIREESGPAAIFHYRSGGSLGLLKHLTDFFFERFGPVTTKRGDICSGAGDAAQELDFGDEESHDLFDLLNARNILLWGKNVFTSSPHTLPVLLEARKRGTQLVLIDPVHQKTATICERFVQPRPAGDFALAMGVARVLFERDLVDPDAPRYCDHLDAFRALAFSRAAREWAADADVRGDVLDDLAMRLGARKPAAILVGWGMGRRQNGAAIVRALDALCAISGNIGVPGGGVSFYYKRRGAFDTSFVRGKKAAPRTVCEPLFGAEVLAMRDPPIRAVWVTAGNPVVMLPESRTSERALRSRELVVVVDSFLTDTARCAHLVLPTTTLLEADDLLGAYGHHYIGSAKPVIPRPDGVRSDLEIVQALAARVGLGRDLEGEASAWKEKILAPKMKPQGVTLERLDEAPLRNPIAPRVLFADRKFPTATGRVNLMHQPPAEGARPSGAFPLLLLALSTDRAQCSQWARPQKGAMDATVHPSAAADIADGTLARLESAIGSMIVRVRHDAKQRRDVVVMAKGGHLVAGRCANVLVSAKVTDLGEGGALYDEAVRLIPLTPSQIEDAAAFFARVDA
jgi:anaerobic selenocysteine-containing dehydrogenase